MEVPRGTTCVPAGHLQESRDPSGRKPRKSLKKVFLGLLAQSLALCVKKSPFLYRAPDFLTESAHFWGTGKWEFFDPETLFSRFGDFDPCRGANAFATQVVPRTHPLRPCVFAYFNRFGSKGAFRLPERRGITSVARWNLRPVIFGVESFSQRKGGR